MNLGEILAGGQERRKKLDQTLGETLNYYMGPTGIPQRLAALGVLNPVNDMEQASQKAKTVFSPDATGRERFDAGVGMVTDMATVLAPVAGASKAGGDATAAVVDSLLGIGQPTRQGLQDAGQRFAADQSGAIRLWHGSPYDFDAFSLDKVGTGEGAQDLGRGFSLSDDEVVAHLYTNPASRWGDLDAMRKYSEAGPGRYYDVSVDANPEQFLDWGKPWREQVKEGTPLYDALVSREAEMLRIYGDDPAMVAAIPSAKVSNIWKDQSGLEEAATQSGFAGNLRKNFGGDTEYTVFDPALMSIERKFDKDGNILSGAVQGSKADEIARMLREGRASDVTDDMMAALDPNDNMRLFQLYEDGATGMPMPMDEASRMARARDMGFDADLYHGTDGELRGAAFDNYASGRVDSGYLGRGTYASEAPRVASGYASRKADMPGASDAPNVMPISVRQGNQLNITPEVKQELSGLDPYDRMDWGFDRQRDGFNSIRVNYGQKRGSNADEVVTFDPRDIRSRFARFDPRLKHLANLSAAGAGVVPLGALLANYDQDAEQRKLRDYLQQ